MDDSSGLPLELFEMGIDQFQIILKVFKVLFVVFVGARVRPMLRNGSRFLSWFGKEVFNGLVQSIECG
jgi:hypothetical protein